ncbi:hypothetical protein [Clostridium sp. OS1-26]|uniref:hypothetical protein n=1 Tax=Clostridium sp. OS1-26 TaxID=3070681 RepID=UPI0027DF7D42|nr:hypothetical protein [Clostridium sp. OS1-26]WML35369.1 hypothetical protein RCG18_00995 [Clostridium sp. OS1-26]
MEEYKCCEECNKNITELHHIVFRGQASYMANIKINFMYLCPDHHRGNDSPHMNKEIDFKYKYELQTKLFGMFNKPYYTEKEIKDLLETTSSEVRKIVKKLKLYKEGYERVDLVARLMGGRIYAK